MSGPDQPRFAALGHQEDWQRLCNIMSGMRPANAAPLAIDEIRTIIPWIPPRTVSRFSVAAAERSARITGVYIDTFISPDELGGRPTRGMLGKVADAIRAAEREGVSVMTLGGFTSILLESDRLGISSLVPMTTGNSLTAALIVRGVERATAILGRDLGCEDLLVIGATGDVGSACARILKGRTRTLLLSARNRARLDCQAEALAGSACVEWSTDVDAMLTRASIVIAAASTAGATFDLRKCRADVIVCDAGYPKNVAEPGRKGSGRLFWGGMGVVAGGLRSHDGILERFYRFPVPDAAHGCMLEGAVLALAGRFEAFSQGRGQITPGKVAEIWALAEQFGVRLAPLFNGQGVWPEELSPTEEAFETVPLCKAPDEAPLEAARQHSASRPG